MHSKNKETFTENSIGTLQTPHNTDLQKMIKLLITSMKHITKP